MDRVCGCGLEEAELHDDICLGLQMNPLTNFVYPPAVLDSSEPSSLSRYDKVVMGTIHIEAKEETRIGPVKVAWEVCHEPKDLPSEVLARFEADVRVGDSTIPQGSSIMPWALTVTHLLPPYTTTPFDAVLNKVFASILLPVPDYVASTSSKTEISESGPKDVHGRLMAFRRHSLSPSLAGSSGTTTPTHIPSPTPSEFEIAKSPWRKTWSRNLLPSPTRPKEITEKPVEIPKRPAPKSSFARIWRMAHFSLPSSLQPSMASAWSVTGVISCPDQPGELPSMEWTKSMRIEGLGKVDIMAYSAYCACGSGIEFDIKFEELNPLATVQSIQLSIAELTVAGDGCAEPGKRDETWFSLFTIGNPDPEFRGSSLANEKDARVWRGGVPASYDRLSATTSASSTSMGRLQLWKGKGRDRLEQPPSDTGPVYHPDLVDAVLTPLGDSFTLKRQCRLPSPIVGIHSSTPTLLDPRISRVTHRLRVEVLFSVLGLDEHDQPLPPLDPKSGSKPKSKFRDQDIPQEGTTRRLWVEHLITLRVCMLSPDSTIIPSYDSANQVRKESFNDYLARIQVRKEPSAFTVPNNRGRIDLGEGSNDLRERTEEHIDDCQARCLCFYGDNAVYALIARKDKTGDQEDQGGVKATYDAVPGGE